MVTSLVTRNLTKYYKVAKIHIRMLKHHTDVNCRNKKRKATHS